MITLIDEPSPDSEPPMFDAEPISQTSHAELDRYIIGVERVPPPERVFVRSLLDDELERNWQNLVGGDDNARRFPLGSPVSYAMDMTPDEADELASHDNVRFVERDQPSAPAIGGAVKIPTINTLASMRANFDERKWHGRNVIIAILDQGTTKAVRDFMGWTLVARAIHGADPGPAEIFAGRNHGCLVAPDAVPYGGMLLDGMIIGSDGLGYASYQIAGMRWAVDNGAKIINCSFAGYPTDSAVWKDVLDYVASFGAQYVQSMGNDNLNVMNYPQNYCKTYSNVHSSIALDERFDLRSTFSNYDAAASGSTPGTRILSLTPDAQITEWDGTSGSGPHKVRLIACGSTDNTFTSAQVAAALRANTRDTGQPAAQQGLGAWDLRKALTALGAVPNPVGAIATPSIVDYRWNVAAAPNFSISAPAALQPGDVRVAIALTWGGGGFNPPDKWVSLDDVIASSVGVSIMASIHQASSPAQTLFYCRDQRYWYGLVYVITLRSIGGLDPALIVPSVKFGVSNVAEAPTVDPINTNDLLLDFFAQRSAAIDTATITPRDTVANALGNGKQSGTGTGYQFAATSKALSSASRVPAAYADAKESTAWVGVSLTVPGTPAP